MCFSRFHFSICIFFISKGRLLREWKANDEVWAVWHGVEVEKQSTIAVFTSLLPASLQVRNVPSSSIVSNSTLEKMQGKNKRNQNYSSVVFIFFFFEKWFFCISSTGKWRFIVFGGCRSSFGIAFDIDGVILRGRVPIGGSPQALRRLYRDYGTITFKTLSRAWNWFGNTLHLIPEKTLDFFLNDIFWFLEKKNENSPQLK